MDLQPEEHTAPLLNQVANPPMRCWSNTTAC